MAGLQHKSSKFQVKDFDDDTRIVKAYASVFNNSDSDNDVIKPGSYKKSIKEWGPEGKDRIKLVAQHDIKRPVARITSLKEDENGLYMEAKFGTHSDGEDYYRMTKEGIVNEISVGFIPVEKEANDKDGFDITNIKLYEVSMVTIAANDRAVVTDVKSADIMNLVKQVKDTELQFTLEKEVLKWRNEPQETTTETVAEATSGQDVVKEDALDLDVLNKLFNN